MHPDLVTIGIPCYQAGPFLEKAVTSALQQLHAPVEVIVVDDGSTDNTETILRSFGDRIRWMRHEHRGAPAARNAILREARGSRIQYLDADDYLLPEKIAAQLAAPRAETADVVYSPVWVEIPGPGGVSSREKTHLDSSLDLSSQWFLWQLPQTGGALWKKSALEQLGGWNEAMPCCQEHELYLRAIETGLGFVHHAEPGAVYRIWSEQTLCRRNPILTYETKADLILRHAAWLRKKGTWTPEHQASAGRTGFEIARALALLDSEKAACWHRTFSKQDLISLSGPAAPRSYRLAYRLLGFSAAETLARRLRRKRTTLS